MNSELAGCIRRDYLSGVSCKILSKKYKKDYSTLSKVLNNLIFFDSSYSRPHKKLQSFTIEQFILKSRDIHGDLYIYDKSVYVNNHTHVIIICKLHGEFRSTPQNHFNKKNSTGCPKCGIEKSATSKKLNNQSIDSKLIDNSIPIIRIGDYKGDTVKISFKCINCNFIFSALPTNVKRPGRKSCPECCKYTNEKIVGDYLSANNIKYIRKSIIINGKKVIPDYWIESLNLFIEYNGAQHYRPVCFATNTSDNFKLSEEKFKKQQERDNNLRNYCDLNGINLLEIDGRIYKYKKLTSFLQQYFKGKSND